MVARPEARRKQPPVVLGERDVPVRQPLEAIRGREERRLPPRAGLVAAKHFPGVSRPVLEPLRRHLLEPAPAAAPAPRHDRP